MTAARTAGPAPGRILVVDDVEANRVLLQEILQLEGHQVSLASNGADAIRLVGEGDPDLVLLDVTMPGMDGLEVCRALRADPNSAVLPIILVTALADRQQRLEGIAAGANDYLTKPIDRTDLVLRVRNTIGIRRLNREVTEQYQRLRELEHMRDSLVHMLVHDLRTPLTGISGYLQLARMRAEELADASLLADFDQMSQSVTELTDMVSDVLDVSRFESNAMPVKATAVDLRALIAQAIAQVGASRHATVEFHPDEAPVPAHADGDLIRRVIANLVGNAIKFTPRGGVVRVWVGVNGSGPEVRVSDSGPGIPADLHGKIFEKFGQVDGDNRPRVRSSGLGLAYCKLAVEAHRGRIGVESQAGQGSTFWFWLPGTV